MKLYPIGSIQKAGGCCLISRESDRRLPGEVEAFPGLVPGGCGQILQVPVGAEKGISHPKSGRSM